MVRIISDSAQPFSHNTQEAKRSTNNYRSDWQRAESRSTNMGDVGHVILFHVRLNPLLPLARLMLVCFVFFPLDFRWENAISDNITMPIYEHFTFHNDTLKYYIWTDTAYGHRKDHRKLGLDNTENDIRTPPIIILGHRG